MQQLTSLGYLLSVDKLCIIGHVTKRTPAGIIGSCFNEKQKVKYVSNLILIYELARSFRRVIRI